MPTSALAYPNISFADPSPVRMGLLLWDNMYRIVPPGVVPHDNPEVEEFADRGFIVSLSPERYREKASKTFKEELGGWSKLAAGLNHEIREEEAMLHEDKVYLQLREQLVRDGPLKINGEWLVGPRALIDQYMIYLATEVAAGNQLAMVTNSPAAWTSQAFFEVD